MGSFDSIAAGQKRSFRIEVGGDLKRYRRLSVTGFDVEGFEVVAVDDNEAILKAREAEEHPTLASAVCYLLSAR